MKKKILIIFGIIVLILMFIVGSMLYFKTNNIYFFLISQTGIVLIKLLGIGLGTGYIMFLINNLIFNNKPIKKLLNTVSIILLILIPILVTNFTPEYRQYTINNKKINEFEMIYNVFRDCIFKQTEEIQLNNIRFDTDLKFYHTRSGTNRFVKDYYITIDTNKYIIPINQYEKATRLIYSNNYGEKSVNTITVYKNSKLVKSINGIELTADFDEIKKFINEQEYIVNVNLNENGIIEYRTIGCTFNEFINNEIAYLCTLNEQGKTKVQQDLKDENKLPTNLANGTYRVCVCKLKGGQMVEVGNCIRYQLNNNTVSNVVIE